MSLAAYVVGQSVVDGVHASSPETTIEETLGMVDSGLVASLGDVVGAIIEAASSHVVVKSDLTIEMSASLSIGGSGSMKYVLFNFGGEVAKNDTVKIVLKTNVEPRNSIG